MDKKNRAWISFWFPLILVALSHTPFSNSFTDERDGNMFLLFVIYDFFNGLCWNIFVIFTDLGHLSVDCKM